MKAKKTLEGLSGKELQEFLRRKQSELRDINNIPNALTVSELGLEVRARMMAYKKIDEILNQAGITERSAKDKLFYLP